MHGGQCFLPCTYGYATTIRRAQGATYHHGCLCLDHSYPPERGYGYVGASRFKTKNGIYLYGKIRRTDWQPVRQRGCDHDDQVQRGDESMSDYNSEEEDADAGRDEAMAKREENELDSDYDDFPDSYGADADRDVNLFAAMRDINTIYKNPILPAPDIL